MLFCRYFPHTPAAKNTPEKSFNIQANTLGSQSETPALPLRSTLHQKGPFYQEGGRKVRTDVPHKHRVPMEQKRAVT